MNLVTRHASSTSLTVAISAVPLLKGECQGENIPDESAYCTHEPPYPPYGHPLPLGGGEGKGEGVRRFMGEGVHFSLVLPKRVCKGRSPL